MERKKLGPYEIVEPLGSGGMGAVYRAHDPSLRRDVAIKVLPTEVASDPDRLARLEREAHSLAALNHPNVATIHGLEEAKAAAPDGASTRFLVLELVQGDTLEERLRSGPMEVEEALELAAQIARGLEAAHAQGIVHRDLKPANVKVTPDGLVKVLDFGLAKPAEARGDGEGASGGAGEGADEKGLTRSPTVTVAGTETGVILGTAAYMSPEQARGKAVDERTDVWSFGCVLYEMLARQRPFLGEDVQETLAAILRDEPDWSALPAGTPVIVRSLLRRCLSKDRDRRLHHMTDARLEIEEGQQEQEPGDLPGPGVPAATDRSAHRRGVLQTLGGVGVVAIVVLLGWLLTRPAPAPRELHRWHIQPPAGVGVAESTAPATLAISPDGRWVAFRGESPDGPRLYLRSVGELDARPVSGTDGAWNPFFSPDSRWLGFSADGFLQKIPVEGDVPIEICPAPQVRGASWGEDGTILFAALGRRGGLFRVSAEGGEAERVTVPDPETGEFHFWPHHLPGGRAALFMVHSGQYWSQSTNRFAVLSLETGDFEEIWTGGTYPRYVSTGHLVYLRYGTLYAAPFDLDAHEVTGEPRPVQQDVYFHGGSGYAAFGASGSGSLVYVRGAPRIADSELVSIDRRGSVEPLVDERRPFESAPSFSPDGDRFTILVHSSFEDFEAWIYDVPRQNGSRLTGARGGATLWSPHGEWIVLNAAVQPIPKITRIRADGTGEPELLTRGQDWDIPGSFSPDGNLLAFMRQVGPGEWDLLTLPLEGDGTPRTFLATPDLEAFPAFSPDGRWIAYESDRTGQREIYVRPYPGPGARTKVSTEGGWTPQWNPDGTEVLYRSGQGIWVVPVETAGEFRVTGQPRLLFEKEFLRRPWENKFTISPDGQRIFLVRYAEETDPELRVAYVPDWSEELKRMVARER